MSKLSQKPTTPDLFAPSAPWCKPVGFREENLTSEERKVYDVMKFHVGAALAIKQEEIARITNMTDRQVQDILKHLTERHGLGLAASVRPPYGVYAIDTQRELDDYCGQLHSRALSQLRREAILRRRKPGELAGQVAAELEAEEN